jgi:hypothetical protein
MKEQFYRRTKAQKVGNRQGGCCQRCALATCGENCGWASPSIDVLLASKGYLFRPAESSLRFVALFAVSFLLALGWSAVMAWISREAVATVLRRFIVDPVVQTAFGKYTRFAVVVVGVSSGTRVKLLQEYISASEWTKGTMQAALTQEFWTLEFYRTVMATLEGVITLLLICIFLTLIAPAVLRMLKIEPPKTGGEPQRPRDS